MSLEETTVAPAESGAETTVDSAPSTEPDFRSMSADEILDFEPSKDTNADEPAAHDATDAKDVAEAKTVDTSKPEEKPVKAAKGDEELEDFEPESIKSLYARPELKAKLETIFKEHPEVRANWFRSAQVAELFPTVAEAREIRTLFPTVEGAKMAANANAVLADLDRAYVDDPQGFVSNLSRGNPDAFANMLGSARDVLYQQNPRAYAELIGNPVAVDLMRNARQRAEDTGNETLAAALDIIAEEFKFPDSGKGPKRPAAPEDPRIRQFEQMKREATEANAQAFDAFSSRVDQTYWDGLNKVVAEAIGKPEAVSPKALERLTNEVIADITKEMAARPDLKPQYERFKRMGGLTDEHRDKVANFLLNYAKAYVGKSVRVRMGEWTKEILRANKEEIQRVDAKPKHKDVGAGSGRTNVPAKGTGKVDYRKVSDNQILDGDF